MNRVRLGRVAGVFGIQGWVRIASDTRPADNIFRYRRWWLGDEESGFESRVVARSKPESNALLAQLSGRDGMAVSDRDLAQALVGLAISVEREALPKLPEGEYYWVDLFGLEVINVEGVRLGVIREMTSNGAQDVMVVAEEGEAKSQVRLIPFVRGPIVQSVDMAARRVICDWQPEW
jgi:16S rRNA processing protein RimM